MAGLLAATRYRETGLDMNGHVEDRGTAIRVQAVQALAVHQGAERDVALREALTDNVLDVRLAALEKIIGGRLTQHLDVLLEALPVIDAGGRDRATKAIIGWAPDGLPERYALALIRREDPDLEVARSTLLAFVAADDREEHTVGKAIAGVLIDIVESEDQSQSLRNNAADIVRGIGAAAHDTLRDALRRHDADARVVRLAGEMGADVFVEDLTMLCEHRAPTVRAAATLGLGIIGDPRAVPSLIRATQDPTFEVRVSALAAMEQFEVAEIVVSLAAAASQPVLQVQAGGPVH